MRIADGWKDYRIIDTASGEKLEMWGDVCLARPDPQIIWNTPKGEIWKKADAHYRRSNTGGGQWEFYHKLPDHWTISYKELRFQIKPTGFKHTGLFPEQAVNWELFDRLIRPDRKRNTGFKFIRLYRRGNACLCRCRRLGLSCRRLQRNGCMGKRKRLSF